MSSDPARDLAGTVAANFNRPINRLLKSVAVGNGVLYAYSVKDHAVILILYLGSDGYYAEFTHTRGCDWEAVFSHVQQHLRNEEAAIEPVVPQNYMDAYGRQVECPEFRKLGLRIFTTCLDGKQMWTVYFWPRKWVRPKYRAVAQQEIKSVSERDGLIKLMLALYEAYPLASHFRRVVNGVIYRLHKETGNE